MFTKIPRRRTDLGILRPRQPLTYSLMLFPLLLSACNSAEFSPVNAPVEASELGSYTINVAEKFTQGSQPASVDILVVMDNSRSMVMEQERMAERTQNLLNEIESLNWQIGFTTTDVSTGVHGLRGDLMPLAGRRESVLRKDNPDARFIFGETMKREETLTCTPENCPSGDEQPLAAVALALSKKNSSNAGFFREEADVMVLIISDEDERSNGAAGATTGEQLVASVRRNLRPDQKFIVSAIVVKPGDNDCLTSQAPDGRTGNIISAAVTLTGGYLGSVCADDYAEQLKAIGELFRKSADTFEVTQAPNRGTMRLSFDPPQPDTRWKIIGKRIVFTQNPPPVGTTMNVSYDSEQ